MNPIDQFSGSQSPVLSVIVPVFNEERCVGTLLDRLLEEPTRKEVIIVDDGSSDSSAMVIKSWLEANDGLNSHTTRIEFISHAINRGKGAAVRTGLQVAEGKYFAVQDSDLELDPKHLGELIRPLVMGEAQVVLGVRAYPPNSQIHVAKLGVAFANGLYRVLYGYKVRDSACCYKLAATDVLRAMHLDCNGFEFCAEFLAKVARMQLSIVEVDVPYFPRGVNDGKKLRIVKDGLRFFATLWRFRKWSPSA